MSDTAPAPAAAPATTAAPTETSAALGGASTPPPAAPPAAPAVQPPPRWTKEDGSFEENWYKLLPPDLQGEKSLHTQKGIEGLARTVVHQNKMIGAEKLPLPPKNATPEELAKWDGWNKLGRPETPDGYDLKTLKPLGDGIPYDYEGEKAFLKDMHGLGLTQTQATGLLAKYRESIGGQYGQITEKTKAEQTQAQEGLKKEYGQAFDKKMNDATQYIRGVLGEKADALIQKHQFDADFIRVMVTAAEANREHPRVDGKSVPINGALSPAEAKQELAELMSAAKDPKHPLNNKMDPLYASMNAKYLKLHEFITAGG
jgi:hypothetical protein